MWPLLAVCLDLSGLSYDECLVALALQGIVNRNGPRVFPKTGSLFWQNGKADDWWIGYYRERKGLRFEFVKSLDEFVARFAGEFRGLVLFDPSLDASRYVALTLCGLENLLPASPDLLYKHPSLRRLRVVHDLRGRWPNDVEAYEWAIRRLLPRTDRKVCFSAGPPHKPPMGASGNGSRSTSMRRPWLSSRCARSREDGPSKSTTGRSRWTSGW